MAATPAQVATATPEQEWARAQQQPQAEFAATPAATCVACGDAITDGTKRTSRQGKVFHSDCFVCEVCDNPVGSTYFEHDGKLFCPTHPPEPR